MLLFIRTIAEGWLRSSHECNKALGYAKSTPVGLYLLPIMSGANHHRREKA